MDHHAVDIPVDAEGLDPVDKPHFGRKGVLAAERNAVQRPQDGQILRAERMLPGTEFTHDLAFGEEYGFLRLLNYKLGVCAQVRMREAPCEYRITPLG